MPAIKVKFTNKSIEKLTIEDLKAIQDNYKDPRVRGSKASILLCGGSACKARGSAAIQETLLSELKNKGIDGEVSVYETGCNGFCNQSPVMTIYPDMTLYQTFKPADIPSIVEEHFTKGQPAERFVYKDLKDKKSIPNRQEIPFFSLQTRRVLNKCGLIEPDDIEAYIYHGGYMAMARAVAGMRPQEIVREIKDSGLRGRGGGGFPTGLKWEICGVRPDETKYVICNAGPISRSIVETDPHSIIEGMIIAGRAVGAKKGFVYVREPDNLFILRRLHTAIERARLCGFLGDDIFNSGFNFTIDVAFGAGTFICGEETALIRSLEGKRGFPTPKPPFPAQSGLWGRPTIVDNAETFANVPLIIANSPAWFRSVGTHDSPGTKIFTLSGAVNSNGLIEVPMGTTFRTIVYDIGGGLKKKSKFKAIHIGGPTGGVIPESLLDTPATYEAITAAGVIVGSGNIIVMDNNTCMVNEAMSAMEFGHGESCGKCVPCRIGTKVMYDKLLDITEGRGKLQDLDTLAELAYEVKRTSLCGLGQTSPIMVLTALKHFREEFEEHITEGWCEAGKCRSLSTFVIESKTCTGCGSCARKCPQEAISGEKKKPHLIDKDLCIKCRSCFETCPFNSIRIEPGVAEEVDSW
ncbi:NADH-ubiquinone oxidoreductase-F iron-sulfur binding region domain-containing protein [Candidatus Magnetominusculus dajiuhuensis]|uniref:NADH-ubiquinone oxidoreductase-F iron-sulfur binding region domain-containing protein n=1 Tax=Candidatus Magnetominusculus dajiuhuensis TaxID=3137712 RepID=UPI003B430AB6